MALKRVPGTKELGPLLRFKEGHSHKPGATLAGIWGSLKGTWGGAGVHDTFGHRHMHFLN